MADEGAAVVDAQFAVATEAGSVDVPMTCHTEVLSADGLSSCSEAMLDSGLLWFVPRVGGLLGIAYRFSPADADLDPVAPLARFGSVIRGVPFGVGEEWLSTAGRYLPFRVYGVLVLRALDANDAQVTALPAP